MSHTKYEPAFGVCPIRWQAGEPIAYMSPVLVEVWTASTRLNAFEPRKPGIVVTARVEVRVRVGDEWQRVGYHGQLEEVTPGEVRRHARLSSRTWQSTITLDGWN